MTFDAMVLRAMLRLARRREAALEDALAHRVSGGPSSVRAALRRLEASGLVERRRDGAARLTLEGFALAVALLPAAAGRSARRVARAA